MICTMICTETITITGRRPGRATVGLGLAESDRDLSLDASDSNQRKLGRCYGL